MWSYVTQSQEREYTVTSADASLHAGGDIKGFADSALHLQQLLDTLGNWSDKEELIQEDGDFRLSILNNCSEAVSGINVSYSLGGKPVGSSYCTNADGSEFSKGDSIIMTFTPEDFPDGTNAVELSDFSFDLDITTADGRQIAVCKGKALSAKYAWTFFYTLSGDSATGFTLNEG